MKTIKALLLLMTASLAITGKAEQPALKIATLEYPPYIQNLDGKAQGLFPEIIREAFRRMGRPIEITIYPWSRSLALLESGESTALFSIKKTPEREAKFRYPKETLFSQDYVFFVRKGSGVHFDGNYASLAKARIGVVKNNSYGMRFDEAVKRNDFPRLEVAYDYEHNFRMLLHDRIDAVMISRQVGMNYVKKLGASDRIVVSGPPSETARSYLIFTRANDTLALAEEYDRTMAAMRKDGSLARIVETHR